MLCLDERHREQHSESCELTTGEILAVIQYWQSVKNSGRPNQSFDDRLIFEQRCHGRCYQCPQSLVCGTSPDLPVLKRRQVKTTEMLDDLSGLVGSPSRGPYGFWSRQQTLLRFSNLRGPAHAVLCGAVNIQSVVGLGLYLV